MSSDEVMQSVIENRAFSLAASGLDDEQTALTIAGYLKGIGKEGTRVVSLIGGAASGKSVLARKVAVQLGNTAIIGTDDFLLGSRDYRRKYFEGGDPLNKYDFGLLREKVNRIRNLRPDELESVPVYDQQDGTAIEIVDFDPGTGRVLSVNRDSFHRMIGKVEFLIVEGDFQPLANPDFQIFLHVPDDVRLWNRIERDRKERGAVDTDEITKSFYLRQSLQHMLYTLPCAKDADVLITAKVIETNARYEYRYWLWGLQAHGYA